MAFLAVDPLHDDRRSIARRDRGRRRLGTMFLGSGRCGYSRPKEKDGEGEGHHSARLMRLRSSGPFFVRSGHNVLSDLTVNAIVSRRVPTIQSESSPISQLVLSTPPQAARLGSGT